MLINIYGKGGPKIKQSKLVTFSIKNNMNKVVIKILQGSVVTQTVLGG